MQRNILLKIPTLLKIFNELKKEKLCYIAVFIDINKLQM